MAKFVLDSYSLLAFFRDEPGADAVEKLLNEAAEDKHELYITVVNVGEVYYMSCRKDSVAKANQVWEAMRKFPLHFIEIGMDITLAAAKIKANYKLSYADAFAAALTIQKKATLVTGDNEFEALEGETNFKVKYL
jgi:predicted nucleic acid-binding protein